jgi:(p)ppGpp synthase/HD superfamily hydrolase
LRFNNALVNGVIKPIAYILASGDVVSINTYKNKYTATKYRFDYLYTPTSKSKLTRFLKQQERELYIAKGTDMLNIKLANANLPLLYNDKDLIHKAYTAHAMEHILMQIASKAQSISTLIKEYYPNALAHQIIQKKPSDTVTVG